MHSIYFSQVPALTTVGTQSILPVVTIPEGVNGVAQVAHHRIKAGSGRPDQRKPLHPRRSIKKQSPDTSSLIVPKTSKAPRVANSSSPHQTSSTSETPASVFEMVFVDISTSQLKRRADDSSSSPTQSGSEERDNGPLWTSEELARLLQLVKNHDKPKSREFWKCAAAQMGRSPEGCRKKYYKSRNAGAKPATNSTP